MDQYVPPPYPSDFGEDDLGPYPLNQIVSARKTLLRCVHTTDLQHGSRWQYIRYKLGINQNGWRIQPPGHDLQHVWIPIRVPPHWSAPVVLEELDRCNQSDDTEIKDKVNVSNIPSGSGARYFTQTSSSSSSQTSGKDAETEFSSDARMLKVNGHDSNHPSTSSKYFVWNEATSAFEEKDSDADSGMKRRSETQTASRSEPEASASASTKRKSNVRRKDEDDIMVSKAVQKSKKRGMKAMEAIPYGRKRPAEGGSGSEVEGQASNRLKREGGFGTTTQTWGGATKYEVSICIPMLS